MPAPSAVHAEGPSIAPAGSSTSRDRPAIRETARRRSGERLGAGEAYQEFTRGWAAECLRVLRPGASRAERDAGCEALPPRALDLFPSAKNGRRPPPASNPHPTVKPLALMRWLVRLLAPEGGLVLDAFCGSGTTGCAAALEGRRFLGIECEPAYVEIARARIAHWDGQRAGAYWPAPAPEPARAGKDGGS